MRVTLHLFAIARQKAGASAIDLELPEPGTVADLKKAVVTTCPALASILPGLLFAVNNNYASDDMQIPIDAELAAIPPVSGGAPETERVTRR
jgi:molybdopterin converting factor small subunit